jgi:hypothetical protein
MMCHIRIGDRLDDAEAVAKLRHHHHFFAAGCVEEQIPTDSTHRRRHGGADVGVVDVDEGRQSRAILPRLVMSPRAIAQSRY